MKTNLIWITIIVALLFSLSGVISMYVELEDSSKKEITRLSGNITSLTEDVKVRKTENGNLLTKNKQLNVSLEEAQKQNLISEKQIKDMGIKIKRLESVSTTIIKTEVKVPVYIKDTTDSCLALQYKDQYIELSGVFCDNGFDTLAIATLDTLHIFAHRIPKKFLFFEYGTKAIEVEAYTTSPYSNIIYSNTIKLNERRKKIINRE